MTHKPTYDELEAKLNVVENEMAQLLKVQEKMQESEKNFRTFFNAMNDMIIVANPDGKIIYSNPVMTRKLGYSSEEIGNMHVLDAHPPDKRSEAEAIFSSMFKGELDVCPLPLQSKAGALIPVETRVWFGTWSGEPCIFGLCKDLSKEQEALQKFNRLFLNNPAPMAVSSLPERIFTDVNISFVSKLGYSRSEIIGRTSKELGLFVQPEIQEDVVKKLSMDGHISNIELKVKCKDGSILDGIFFGDVIESQGQKYFLSVMVDQTERKHVEEALKSSEEKFRLLIENSHDIIYILSQEGTFLFVSPTWTTLLGHSVTQVKGQTFQPFVHPDDLPGCMEFLRSLITTGKRQGGIEYRVRHADGTWYWHTSSGVPFKDEKGSVIGFYGIARDITERKQRETERENLISELEKALAEVKTLSGLLPICAWCKKIRDDEGYWNQIEVYIGKHSEAQFSHSICPDCYKEIHPKYSEAIKSIPYGLQNQNKRID